jgi:hypothetical protein
LYLTIKALQIVFWTEKKCGHIQRQQVDASSSLLPQISAPWRFDGQPGCDHLNRLVALVWEQGNRHGSGIDVATNQRLTRSV